MRLNARGSALEKPKIKRATNVRKGRNPRMPMHQIGRSHCQEEVGVLLGKEGRV